MYSTKQSSKPSRLRDLEHISRPLALILVAIKHLQDDILGSIPPPEVRSISTVMLWRISVQHILQNFLKMFLRWSFFFAQLQFIPSILQKLCHQCFPRNLLYFTVHIFFRTDLHDSLQWPHVWVYFYKL